MLNLAYQENGRRTGTLSLKADFLLNRLDARPSSVSIIGPHDPERPAAEDFIRKIYADAYDARINIHYPQLMILHDLKGKILAAIGYRNAGQAPLFLEQYLSHPVEEILGTPRTTITEIGNLASAGGGASLLLFAALSAYLHDKGQTHAVVTATGYLEKRIRTLGLRPVRLAKADPSLLLRGDEDWGSYYDTMPYVLAGEISRGYRRLQTALGGLYTRAPLAQLHMMDCR